MSKLNIIEKYNQINSFGKTFDMHFHVLKRGEVEYFMNITNQHLATQIVAHGGVIAGFMDAVLAVSGLSYTEQDGNVVSTVEFKINYLKPALLGDKLKGVGKVISAGKRILYIEGEIFALREAGEVLIAKGSGTFNAYPAEKARLI